jgi:hypothetical protein
MIVPIMLSEYGQNMMGAYIIYRHAQLTTPCRQEELHLRIQSHVLFVAKKIWSLLEHQGSLVFQDLLQLLSRIKDVLLEV